jgi:hypothetical protein
MYRSIDGCHDHISCLHITCIPREGIQIRIVDKKIKVALHHLIIATKRRYASAVIVPAQHQDFSSCPASEGWRTLSGRNRAFLASRHRHYATILKVRERECFIINRCLATRRQNPIQYLETSQIKSLYSRISSATHKDFPVMDVQLYVYDLSKVSPLDVASKYLADDF